jgi:hypothetical protein
MIKVKDKQQNKNACGPQPPQKETTSAALFLPDTAYSRLMKTNSDINEFLEIENMTKDGTQKHRFEEAAPDSDPAKKKGATKTGTKSVSHFKPSYSSAANIFNFHRIHMPQYRSTKDKSNGGSVTKTIHDTETKSESKKLIAFTKPDLSVQTNVAKNSSGDKKENKKKGNREDNVLFYSELLNQNRFSKKYMYPKGPNSRGNSKEVRRASASMRRFGVVTPKTKLSPTTKVIEKGNQPDEELRSSISELKDGRNSGRRVKGGRSVSREPIYQAPQMIRSQSIEKKDSPGTSQLPTERIFAYPTGEHSEQQESQENNQNQLMEKVKKIFTDQIERVNMEIFVLQQSLNDLRDSLLLPLNRQMKEALQTLESNQHEIELYIYRFQVQTSKIEKIKQDLKDIFSVANLKVERFHIDPRHSDPLPMQENLKLVSHVGRGTLDGSKKDSLANVMRSIRDRKAEKSLRKYNPKNSNRVQIGSVDVSKESAPSLENTSLTIQTPDLHDDTAKFTSFLNSELEKIKRKFLVDDQPNPASDWKKASQVARKEVAQERVQSNSKSRSKRGGSQTVKSVDKAFKKSQMTKWPEMDKVMKNSQYRSVEKLNKLRLVKVDSASETGEQAPHPDKKNLLISRLSQGKIKLKVSPLFE